MHTLATCESAPEILATAAPGLPDETVCATIPPPADGDDLDARPNPGRGAGQTIRDSDLGMEEGTLPKELIVPAGYLLDGQGCLFRIDDKLGAQGIGGGILIVGEMHEKATEKVSLDVCFRTTAGFKRQTVAAEDLADRRRLVGALAGRGHDVTSENAAKFLGWVTAFRQTNAKAMPIYTAHSHAGALGGGNFALGRTIYGRGTSQHRVVADSSGEVQYLDAYGRRGDEAAWVKLLERLPDDAEVWLAMYAAICPLLQSFVAEPDNFLLEMAGESSTGKTTSLRLAASMFGRPGGSGLSGLIQSWRSTAVARERTAGLVPGLPLFLDELTIANADELVGSFYELLLGMGRSRGDKTGLQKTTNWFGTALSTGEFSINVVSQNSGVRARMISLTGLPLGSGDQAALAQDIETVTAVHHGHAAHRLLECLAPMSPKMADKWRVFCRDQRDDYQSRAVSGVQKRLASHFAALHAAAGLFHSQYRKEDQWEERIARAWEMQIDLAMNETPLYRRVQEAIEDWVAANEAHFVRHGLTKRKKEDEVSRCLSPMFGYIRDEDYLFIGQQLDERLEQLGFDPEVSKRALRDNGLLLCEDGRLNYAVTIGNERKRFVRILRQQLKQ